MKTLTVPATPEQLDAVLSFIETELQSVDCPLKTCNQVAIAVEEIFVNISHYAYNPNIGEATIRCQISTEPLSVTIEFLDAGRPYDPLQNQDPDVTLSAEEREIGGLGIFMVKRMMDDVSYEYADGKNILTIRKLVP